MTRIDSAIPRRLRLLLPAALIAATAALGGSAIGDPATACAAPKEWDIDSYDRCFEDAYADFLDNRISKARYQERVQNCCTDSGGQWKPGAGFPGNNEGGDCFAPPLNPAQAPGSRIPPGVDIQTATPVPPPEPAAPLPTVIGPAS